MLRHQTFTLCPLILICHSYTSKPTNSTLNPLTYKSGHINRVYTKHYADVFFTFH